jgi:Fur family iron response transcriptional regulator
MAKTDSASVSPLRKPRAAAKARLVGKAVAGEKSIAEQELRGCPLHDLRDKLDIVGLRPTRQRMRLGWLLFGRGDRHVTAEKLFDEAQASGAQISLATVYNTLNQFTAAGLLREVTVDGARTYFDTNLVEHQHFLTEEAHLLVDLPKELIDFRHLPEPPEGMEIARIDVVVRLRRKDTKTSN